MKKFSISSHGKNNKRVIFLLPGWRIQLWVYWIFAKLFERKGFYCIIYTYDKDTISPNTKLTIKRLKTITDDILLKTRALKKQGYREFSIFGTSLGALIALLASNKSKDISKVILNMMGAEISEPFWNWFHTIPHFKNVLIKKNFTAEDMKIAFKPITPLENINNFHNKKILLYISKKDRLVPYKTGDRLRKEFQRRKYQCEVVVNSRFGHGLSATYNMLRARTYLEFLNA